MPIRSPVVGLPDTAVKESKDRVTSAICNSALRWPSGKRITINLAPADVRKEGPSFDLPIALGMLKLEENNRLPDLEPFCLTGELALSGQLRPVKGVLSIALDAKRRNRRILIEPIHNHITQIRLKTLNLFLAGEHILNRLFEFRFELFHSAWRELVCDVTQMA